MLWPEKTETVEVQEAQTAVEMIVVKGAAMAATRKKEMAAIMTVALPGMLEGVAVAGRKQKTRTAIVELPATSPRSARRPKAIDDAKLALEAPTAG